MITSCPRIIFLWSTAPVSFSVYSKRSMCDCRSVTEAHFFLSSATKDKKGCTALPRSDRDTCLFPVDEKSVEYYFASDARLAHTHIFVSHFYTKAILHFVQRFSPKFHTFFLDFILEGESND